MKIVVPVVPLVATLFVALFTPVATQAGSRAGAVILSPSQKDEVKRESELIGRISARGWPVVLVRADQANEAWWVQGKAQITSPGHFKARVRFGNEQTAPGSAFHAVVVMAQTAEQVEQLPPGVALEELPVELPRSAAIRVTLAESEEVVTTVASVIQSPAPNSIVDRVAELHGLRQAEGQPIVLVRCVAANSPWWVQQPVKLQDDGSFVASIRVGNDKTPDGTRFRVTVIFCTDKHAQSFQPGMSVDKLPADVPRSEEVTVLRCAAASASGTSVSSTEVGG